MFHIFCANCSHAHCSVSIIYLFFTDDYSRHISQMPFSLLFFSTCACWHILQLNVSNGWLNYNVVSFSEKVPYDSNCRTHKWPVRWDDFFANWALWTHEQWSENNEPNAKHGKLSCECYMIFPSNNFNDFVSLFNSTQCAHLFQIFLGEPATCFLRLQLNSCAFFELFQIRNPYKSIDYISVHFNSETSFKCNEMHFWFVSLFSLTQLQFGFI